MESGGFNYILSHHCTSSFLEYGAGREGKGRDGKGRDGKGREGCRELR
jgi:hypothetical protein